MSEATRAALEAIKAAVARGEQYIAPVTFTHFYGRAATAAAFRMARAEGVIEVAYRSCVGTPVYAAAGTAAAVREARGAVTH